MTQQRSRLPLAGVLAGLTFGTGLFTLFTIPGGGDTTDQQFTDFYNSGSHRATAFGLYLVLAVGSWLMVWFYGELAARFGPGPLSAFIHRMATVGATATLVGGGIMLAPASVQTNSNAPFVGVPIAQTLTHAGLLVVIVGGVYTFAATTFILCLRARRASALPGWAAITGMVVAVFLLASIVATPAILLPVWVIIAGLAGRRVPATAPAPVPANA